MSVVREIPALSAVADAYDAFLVDQYGVLRDGRGPYPGAAETLVRLKQAGKRVIILSNSGKRSPRTTGGWRRSVSRAEAGTGS